jgi:hypothetical protein
VSSESEPLRLAHRFAHRDEGREVDHSLRPLFPHDLGQRFGIGKIQHVEPAGGHVVPIPLREIVNHRDVVPLLEQQAHGVCADVSGAARNQDS